MAEKKRRKSAGQERKPFLLRLSPELMEDLKIWSNHEFRSLNGHIEFLLQNAVNQRKRRDSAAEAEGQ